MAKSYRRGLVTRLVNRWFRLLTDLGLGASYRGVTRAYFDATPDSTDEAVAVERPRHAVFRVLPRPG
jgi:hypothetical protein